jgi:hypothetical protein
MPARVTIPDLVTWRIVLALVALIGFLYWAERRYPAPSKPRKRDVALTFCTWCVFRLGKAVTLWAGGWLGREDGADDGLDRGAIGILVEHVAEGHGFGVARLDADH